MTSVRLRPRRRTGLLLQCLVFLASYSIAAESYREDSRRKVPTSSRTAHNSASTEHRLTRRLPDNGPLSMNATTSSNASLPRRHLVLAVIPKSIDSEFFAPTRDGCEDTARHLSNRTPGVTVECLFVGPTSQEVSRGGAQARVLRDLLWPTAQNSSSTNGSSQNPTTPVVDGISISVQDEAALIPLLKQARTEFPDLPILTFDSDLITDPSLRHYYIGTNNSFFGVQLARSMEMLHPSGGTYGILGGEAPNVQARVSGLLSELHHASNPQNRWFPLPHSPFNDVGGNQTTALQQMAKWAVMNPTVLVSVRGLPMRILEDTTTNQSTLPWQEFVDEYNPDRTITLLCGDAMPHQLAFLQADYVNGLLGQSPYDMGTKSIETLYGMIRDPASARLLGDPVSDDDATTTDSIGTTVVSHVHLPLRLPPIDVDHNLIGNLKYFGFTLFGIIVVLGLSCGIWAFARRNVRVVRVAQPRFLIMIALGVLILASSMIPLSLDDGGGSRLHCAQDGIGFGKHCTLICMSVPWCVSIGFTITFSALYSKTRRINKIFHSKSAFGRVEVSEKDVLVPFFVLLAVNLLILILWTILDPLVYTRVADYGTDGWNRVISTYGQCSGDSVEYFLIPLAIVNTGMLLLANWQCYIARDIVSEFSETKYIGICMGSLLQAGITGIPVLLITRGNPPAFYLVATLFVFIICVVVLGSIFVPKIIFTRQYLAMSDQSKKEFMTDMISQTAKASRMRFEASSEANTSSSPMPSTPFGKLSLVSRRLSSWTPPNFSHLPSFGSRSKNSHRNTSGDRVNDHDNADANENNNEQDTSYSGDDGLMFMRKSVALDSSESSRLQRLSFPSIDSSASEDWRRRRSVVTFSDDPPCPIIEEGEGDSSSLSETNVNGEASEAGCGASPENGSCRDVAPEEATMAQK